MKIVIFRTFGTKLDIGSYNCQEIGLAKALASYGHKVSVVMAGDNHQQFQIPTPSGNVDIYTLPYIGTKGLSLFLGWKRLITELSPDIIQIHDVENLMSNCVARYANNNIPCVMICGVHQAARNPITHFAKRVFNNLIDIPTLKRIKYIGAKTQEAAIYANKIHRTPTLITPIGLDEDRFVPEESIDWRKKLSLCEDARLLLYVGRLNNDGRNPLFLLDILKFLPEQYHLIYAGSGTLSQSIEDYAKSLQLQNRTHLVGKITQKQLPSLYRSCEFALMPSVYEIYGMATIEAMYFGIPVISTASAGAKSIISSGINGYIVNGFNHQEWASLIKNCSDSLRLEMGTNASNHIRESLTWSATATKFIDLYNRAIK
ncbi:MAG: glycosyltransferase family 4 protein [Alistipes sp.]|nr:glycosyltransferase family 4 protein [Alistipes sp.]